jgi:hypothetical protein
MSLAELWRTTLVSDAIDEVVYPLDHKTAGHIVDDDMCAPVLTRLSTPNPPN